jgi:hypothetical protein
MVKRDGRFSGEAFMVLSSPMHVEAAMAKHKMYLGSRFVEVFAARKMVSKRSVPQSFTWLIYWTITFAGLLPCCYQRDWWWWRWRR